MLWRKRYRSEEKVKSTASTFYVLLSGCEDMGTRKYDAGEEFKVLREVKELVTEFCKKR